MDFADFLSESYAESFPTFWSGYFENNSQKKISKNRKKLNFQICSSNLVSSTDVKGCFELRECCDFVTA